MPSTVKRNHDILVDALRPFLALCVGEGREKREASRVWGGVHFCISAGGCDWRHAGVYPVHSAACNCHRSVTYTVLRSGGSTSCAGLGCLQVGCTGGIPQPALLISIILGIFLVPLAPKDNFRHHRRSPSASSCTTTGCQRSNSPNREKSFIFAAAYHRRPENRIFFPLP